MRVPTEESILGMRFRVPARFRTISDRQKAVPTVGFPIALIYSDASTAGVMRLRKAENA